jgi:hypothetical protein
MSKSPNGDNTDFEYIEIGIILKGAIYVRKGYKKLAEVDTKKRKN